jgi:WG containing repeat
MYPRRDEVSGRYGYWGRDGWAVVPQFDYANAFVNGYGAVDLGDGRRGLIVKDGTLLPLEEICDGRTPVKTDWSAPDCFCFTGFDYFESQPSRYAQVRTEARGRRFLGLKRRGREWGLIDRSLAYIPLPNDAFSEVTDFNIYGDYVVIKRPTGRLHESLQGLFNVSNMRLEFPLDEIAFHPSLESMWVVSRGWHSDRQWETLRFAFCDVAKRELVSDWFKHASPFSEGFGAIRKGDGPMYFVDASLQPAFDAQFDAVDRFSFGLAAVYKGNDAGYIDTTGQMRLHLPHYDRLTPFNEYGLAIANRDEADWDIDIIDREGRPRLTGLQTAVFWEGDFPHFEVTKDGEDHLFDTEFNAIF